tara:strand:- start:4919 stop:5353 length:435 start_codon:yes stop_codon:yes gene_type:complete
MIIEIKNFLNTLMPPESPKFDNTLAIVCLLCEVCLADEGVVAEEKAAAIQALKKLVNIDQEKAAELLEVGMKQASASNSVFDFTSQLTDLDNESRIALIQSMWEVAYADGYLDKMEEALIRKVAALIYVNHSDFIQTKLTVMPQ